MAGHARAVVSESAATAIVGLLLVGLCACNQVFGLRDTQPLADADYCALNPSDPLFHDEDGDGRDDHCDNCPGIANPLQEDSLELANGQPADGVGDACDPAPTVTGDRLVQFTPFATPADQDAWLPISGSWTVQNDALVHTDPAVADSAEDDYAGQAPMRAFAIEAKIVVDAVVVSGASSFELVSDLDTASRSIGCAVARLSAGSDYAFIASGSYLAKLSTPIAAGASYELRTILTPLRISCRVDDVDGPHVAMGALVNDGAKDRIGLAAYHMAVHVEYVAVYDMSKEP